MYFVLSIKVLHVMFCVTVIFTCVVIFYTFYITWKPLHSSDLKYSAELSLYLLLWWVGCGFIFFFFWTFYFVLEYTVHGVAESDTTEQMNWSWSSAILGYFLIHLVADPEPEFISWLPVYPLKSLLPSLPNSFHQLIYLLLINFFFFLINLKTHQNSKLTHITILLPSG